MEGSIPREWGNLTNLRQLRAYDNQFAGEIPPELGELTNLWQLELQDNLLTGPVPWELTGPFRAYDSEPVRQPSAGVHIVVTAEGA